MTYDIYLYHTYQYRRYLHIDIWHIIYISSILWKEALFLSSCYARIMSLLQGKVTLFTWDLDAISSPLRILIIPSVSWICVFSPSIQFAPQYSQVSPSLIKALHPPFFLLQFYLPFSPRLSLSPTSKAFIHLHFVPLASPTLTTPILFLLSALYQTALFSTTSDLCIPKFSEHLVFTLLDFSVSYDTIDHTLLIETLFCRMSLSGHFISFSASASVAGPLNVGLCHISS